MHQGNIIVLAGGYSVRSYDLTGLEKRGTVIGVNESFLNFDKCDIGITMDRLWMESRIDRIIEKDKPFFTRYAAIKFIDEKKAAARNIRLFECEETHTMSDDPQKINGTSSGMCGFNLALQMKPPVIYLLGFDMGRKAGKPYWYDAYPWVSRDGGTKEGRFKQWVKQFGEISKTLKNHPRIVNVNHQSALECFETITYEEFLKHAPYRQ